MGSSICVVCSRLSVRFPSFPQETVEKSWSWPMRSEQHLARPDAGIAALPLSAAWFWDASPHVRNRKKNPRHWQCPSVFVSKNNLLPPACMLEQIFFYFTLLLE